MSADYAGVRRAIRARLVGMTVATTGATTLAATASGYTRASGSFIADKFEVGMEVTASGFGTAANNGLGIVTRVEALTLSVAAYDLALDDGVWTRTSRTLATEGSSSGRTLAVGLPAVRAWEGMRHEILAETPWVHEQFVGGPSFRPANNPSSEVEVQPRYVLTVHCVAGKGSGAPDRYTAAIGDLFSPGQPLNDDARVRPESGPNSTVLSRTHPGFLSTVVDIPLRIRTLQTIN